VCSGKPAAVVIAPADYDRAGAVLLAGRFVVTRHERHVLPTGVGVLDPFFED
jgi:hypothetical protein